jgi:hypothetical protein
MTLLELNLEKPALVEERVYETDTYRTATETDESSDGGSTRLRVVLGLALAVAAALAVRKLRSALGSDDDEPTPEIGADQSEIGDSGTASSPGKKMAGVFGVVASVVAVALVKKARTGSGDR